MKKKHFLEVENLTSVVCPRCGVLAQARQHIEIKPKQLAQPFYYSRWFNCLNSNCQTTIFMLEEYKVLNKNGAARNFVILKEDRENLDNISRLF